MRAVKRNDRTTGHTGHVPGGSSRLRLGRNVKSRETERVEVGVAQGLLDRRVSAPHNSAGGGAWRDEYLRRAVQNCRRAIFGETPWNLIGPDERML